MFPCTPPIAESQLLVSALVRIHSALLQERDAVMGNQSLQPMGFVIEKVFADLEREIVKHLRGLVITRGGNGEWWRWVGDEGAVQEEEIAECGDLIADKESEKSEGIEDLGYVSETVIDGEGEIPDVLGSTSMDVGARSVYLEKKKT